MNKPERKQGEYEVQATNGTEHDFPQIAQGLSTAEKNALIRKKQSWYRKPPRSSAT